MDASEEWRTVVGYEGLYEVSSFGNVRRVPDKDIRGRPRPPGDLAVHQNSHGRSSVVLTKNRKRVTKTVHRLVAEAFLPPPLADDSQVNHKDGNKLNNRVSNLEWCSCKENHAHARLLGLMRVARGESNGHSILTEDAVRYARAVFSPRHPEFGLTPLARKFGVSMASMCQAVKGVTWKHV